ncbi:MAG: T9SS type A sorting domain-containing protein, partial [Candidatus Krumholzibacteria bacterium]|nr:T9SS type A sorting domain-containing protein [Candidatus Krumholzibacteria bacterium]
DPEWTFSGWSGDLSGSNAVETIVMTGDMSVTANFVSNLDTWTAFIDLNAQDGDNNVANVLAIVPGTGTVPLDPGTIWTLTDSSSGSPLPVTMSVAMDVRYPTTSGVNSEPSTDAGQTFGSIVDGQGGYEIDLVNSFVTLHFNNLDPGEEYSLAVTYNRNNLDYSNRATRFTLEDADAYSNASTPGVVIHSDASVAFSTGNNFENGYVARWTGITDADGHIAITAIQDQSQPGWDGSKGYAMTSIVLEQGVVAPPQYALTADTVGDGGVTLNPLGGVYDAGTSVQVTAVADPEWTFSGWSGDLSGSNAVETIIMTGDMNVTATFTEIPVGAMVCEDFEGFSLGSYVGADDSWFDGGGGPTVTAGIGVAGSVGLTNSGSIFTWADQPFDWNAADFLGVKFSMDFQTSGSGTYDDDRIGWMIHNDSTDSDDIFGVQLDPGGVGHNIECYWDGESFGDNGGRTSIADLPTLTANGWYRLQANITRLTATSARIDVMLTELDGSGNEGAVVASGSIADTDLLANTPGNESPNPGYFTGDIDGDIYPAFKNHNGTTGAADNACFEVIKTAPPFAFVVVADSRTQSHLAGFEADLMQVQDWVNSPTPDMPAPEMLVFAGDFDHTSQTDGIIQTVLGAGFPWYYVIGNHDFETMANFDYCKNTIFPTLPGVVNSGPAGSVGSNYSWDFGNAHFVSVNVYWDGTTNPGADHATSGDVPLALRTWIDTDLAASSQPHKFVFVHEPAYPAVRHIGDSLDAYPANRDAFVTMLDNSGTETLFVGHDHYYHHDVASDYPYLGNVHQVDAGQIQGPNVGGDGSTIIYVLVDGDMTTYKVYRSMTGIFTLFEEWTIGGPLPFTLAMDKSEVPTTYSLGANYPNPFNPSTTIRFTLPTSENVRLSVFDIQGRQVATLVNEVYSAGRHEVVWRGQDNSSRPVASGTYFYRLKTGGFTETKKMLLLK